MRKKIVRRRRPLALASLVLAGAAVAVTALLLGGGTAAAVEGAVCTTGGGEHRLQLNTVTLTPSPSDPLAKTVAMEKDIYACRQGLAGGEIVGYRDLETFVEIVERTATPSTPSILTVDRRVEVAACDKLFATGVKCTTKTMTLGAPVANPFPTGSSCRSAEEFPPDVQMNTVALGNNQVKTIKVDKEVFLCISDDVNQFVDVYLFSEILERLTSAQDNIKPYAKPFEGIACYRDVSGQAPSQAPTITSCTRFTTS